MVAISLFSGMGGDTMGMELAGEKCVGFVECNQDAIRSHQENFPDCPLILDDITDPIFPERLKQFENTPIDFLFAGFPCQSFSHAGKKKGVSDTRGELFRYFIQATDILQPTWILGENVKGILSRKTDKGVPVADYICECFKEIGYTMRYFPIKCWEYGVCQKRERVFFIGSKVNQVPETLGMPRNPYPPLSTILEYSMGGCVEYPNPINVPKWVEGNDDTVTGTPHPMLLRILASGLVSFGRREGSHHGEIVDMDGLSKTIISHYQVCPRLFVPIKTPEKTYLRVYSIREILAIQGFPKDFIVTGDWKKQVTQIGNAVPPPIVQQIVEYLKSLN